MSFFSPWQNGTAERWILSCRHEFLEHVVIFGERHLVQLVRSYICYYNQSCHLGLEKDTPNKRQVTPRPSLAAKIVALPLVGGDSTTAMNGGKLRKVIPRCLVARNSIISTAACSNF
jgi:hypothetical protein